MAVDDGSSRLNRALDRLRGWRRAHKRSQREKLDSWSPPRRLQKRGQPELAVQSAAYGGPAAGSLAELICAVRALPEMDKQTMSGRCISQTRDMERFMLEQVGFRPLPGQFFVPGVKAFRLSSDLPSLEKSRRFEFESCQAGSERFAMSVAEVLEWQSTYQVFYDSDVYRGDEGKETLRRSLEGRSRHGQEAWMMKFACRISENPVLMRFDGRVVKREVGQQSTGKIYLVSVCGIDFAGREHDSGDIARYVKNWREVYRLNERGAPVILRGRDFAPTGQRAELDEDRCFKDLVRMARLRLRAQDKLGIQVVVETGLGLGVFAGDAIGVGGQVRKLSAMALRRVLEEEKFTNIKLVVFALPIFRANENNFGYFQTVFGDAKAPYSGKTAVVVADQDMHAIALAAAEKGYTVGELNPADSHGVFGEYWQNYGPGTEEKLALTTCGLLTQHHVVNPSVLDASRYVAVDVSNAPS